MAFLFTILKQFKAQQDFCSLNCVGEIAFFLQHFTFLIVCNVCMLLCWDFVD